MSRVRQPWNAARSNSDHSRAAPRSRSRDSPAGRDGEGTRSSPSLPASSAPPTPSNSLHGIGPDGGKDAETASAAEPSYSPYSPTPAPYVPPVTTPPPSSSSVLVYPTRSLLSGVLRDTSRPPPTPAAGLGEPAGDYFQPTNASSSGNPRSFRATSSTTHRSRDSMGAAAAPSLLNGNPPSPSDGALPPRASIVMLPPVDSPNGLEYDLSTAPDRNRRQVDEPDEAARDAQRASEEREQKLEDEAQMRHFVTTRLRHERDKDGNHLILGYAGAITRCEDEPIRIPGAVQPFGVLIALRRSEVSESGFEVRQVSENSTAVLGLSPKYLFGLECFTDTLPEDQAAGLFHSLEFLSNMAFDQGDPADQTPQLFELSGFGEPGSARPGDPSDELGRRRWHCTCALHRAPQPANLASESPCQSHLVLEFELYDDTVNPPIAANHTLPTSTASSAQPGSLSSELEPPPLTIGAADDTTDGRRPRTHSARARLNKILPSPSADDIRASTTIFSRPIREIERSRTACGSQQIRFTHALGASSWAARAPAESAVGGSRRTFRDLLKTNAPHDVYVDIVGVMNQCNSQLIAAPDMQGFLNIVVGLVKYLTGFHRVLVYEFDDEWNGQTVAELVDPTKSRDIYRGLHFPASDIPKQARDLYAINKVRALYNRDHPSARLVCKAEEDLDTPLDMTHSLLRAMSPIHLKYLANMQVRASMSISIMGFGKLWGLIACHSYGDEGMRVSFHMRHLLHLFADAVSRNLERLSVTERLPARTLLTGMVKSPNASEYVTSNAEDLLTIFEADYGILVVGNGAKILGQNVSGQELLIIAEYLRLKRFPHVFATKCLSEDYPDLILPPGPNVIAGMLYVPLTPDGKSFIAFLRQTRVQYVHWAGEPVKKENEFGFALNPRDSFAAWTQRVYGKCKTWTSEQIETAAIVAFVYGKFIEVWRDNHPAPAPSNLTHLLLSNASHEVRTPLNQIIGFLELALAAPLDDETRKNLLHTHHASQSLLFTINDLLDLTRLETGQETCFKEPFDLHAAIADATGIYEKEAARRRISFVLDTEEAPPMVWGDAKKIRTAVANLAANAVKYTAQGNITIACRVFEEPGKQRAPGQVVVSVSVEDTGCGIPDDELSSLFRQIEQYQNAGDSAESTSSAHASEVGYSDWTGPTGSSGQSRSRDVDRRRLPLGLGLAVVARIVQQLGGQLRIESKVGRGSTFAFVVPFLRFEPGQTYEQARLSSIGSHIEGYSIAGSCGHSSVSARSPSAHLQIDGIVETAGSSSGPKNEPLAIMLRPDTNANARTDGRWIDHPLRGQSEGPSLAGRLPAKVIQVESFASNQQFDRLDVGASITAEGAQEQVASTLRRDNTTATAGALRVMVVDDEPLNRKVLTKRLERGGHTVEQCSDGLDAVDLVSKGDFAFDCIFMDIQMPVMSGFDATRRIREVENEQLMRPLPIDGPSTHSRTPDERIPIFAVSASLKEQERDMLLAVGFDGWLLKPLNRTRVGDILRGIRDQNQRVLDVYRPGCSWEGGGWLRHGLGLPPTEQGLVRVDPAVDLT